MRQAAARPALGMRTIQAGRQIGGDRPHAGGMLDLAEGRGAGGAHRGMPDGEPEEVRGAASPPGPRAAGRRAPAPRSRAAGRTPARAPHTSGL